MSSVGEGAEGAGVGGGGTSERPAGAGSAGDGAGGADRSGAGWLPLHIAVQHAAPAESVSALLDAFPGAASVPDPDGWLPLHAAAWHRAPKATLMRLQQMGRSVRPEDGYMDGTAPDVSLPPILGLDEVGLGLLPSPRPISRR
jgi:hypothetical protein